MSVRSARGLGQLAYDKGMQILAATQADNVALESERLGQGLLTYALVQDGLKARKAAPDGNGPITIKTWLRYAEKRVPELANWARSLHESIQVRFDEQGTAWIIGSATGLPTKPRYLSAAIRTKKCEDRLTTVGKAIRVLVAAEDTGPLKRITSIDEAEITRHRRNSLGSKPWALS
jgi:hypothetical protein